VPTFGGSASLPPNKAYFVTVRELRAESGKVWEKVEAGEEMVITRNGKPFAILMHTHPDQLDQTLRAIRAARLQNTLDEMRRHAHRNERRIGCQFGEGQGAFALLGHGVSQSGTPMGLQCFSLRLQTESARWKPRYAS